MEDQYKLPLTISKEKAKFLGYRLTFSFFLRLGKPFQLRRRPKLRSRINHNTEWINVFLLPVFPTKTYQLTHDAKALNLFPRPRNISTPLGLDACPSQTVPPFLFEFTNRSLTPIHTPDQRKELRKLILLRFLLLSVSRSIQAHPEENVVWEIR